MTFGRERTGNVSSSATSVFGIRSVTVTRGLANGSKVSFEIRGSLLITRN